VDITDIDFKNRILKHDSNANEMVGIRHKMFQCHQLKTDNFNFDPYE